MVGSPGEGAASNRPLRLSDRDRSAGGHVIVRYGPRALGMSLDRARAYGG